MVALTKFRDTQERRIVSSELNAIDVTDALEYFSGGMIMIDANGRALRAADTAAAVKVVGRSEEDRIGDIAAGNNTLKVRSGVFAWVDAGSDITIADRGINVFVVDDQTIQKAATANSVVAGTVYDVRDGKTWILTIWPLEPASAPA